MSDVQSEVSFPCCYCGRMCHAFANAKVGEEHVLDGVMHELPICAAFEQMEALAFLSANRHAQQLRN
jgi:uncharacterized protein (DUF779 family)